jgi:NADPH-dependent glutamate synthase beta subunit-like oxidoreductase
MGDRFQPISMEDLTDWVFDELKQKDQLFGIPGSAFFVPSLDDKFRIEKYGVEMDTPFGVAAGPHSQMAQNIIVSWLVGARFLELKTVQTLDELEISKPCIDCQDEGYNVEWSQELKVHESFDEYLRAWVLIHVLHHKLGFPTPDPGMIFNMSVGYNLEGILEPNVQWYLDVMRDASDYLPAYIGIVAKRYPEIRDIDIPSQVSNTITLSTMHGCPPDEIERIMTYLLEERSLHASVKVNPTLLGADRVRTIINDDLGFDDVPIPDEAFGHDLMYTDAVPMFHSLRRIAADRNLTFGLKLSNTLEVNNWRTVFPDDPMMYLSGRALHPVTANLASLLSEEYRGDLLMSFAGGADAFNVADLLASGMKTVTVCTDLLKSGGYLRMRQYTEQLDEAIAKVGASDIADFIARTAITDARFDEFAPVLRFAALTDSGLSLDLEAASRLGEMLRTRANGESMMSLIATWVSEEGFDEARGHALIALTVKVLSRLNLRAYADEVRADWRYQKQSFRTDRSKTDRELHLFDCIEAPCVDECPVDQHVPAYMRAVREGNLLEAVNITRRDNPLPSILGRVCDHLCENTCVRTHFDQPLAIRQIKRYIMDGEETPVMFPTMSPTGTRVAIIGAGPAGLAAAQELGYAGFGVTIFEQFPYPGGMVGGAIPKYRLPDAQIAQDVAILDELGVEIRYDSTAGVDFTLSSLRDDGYDVVFIAVGAQLAKQLGLEGEDSDGVVDGITFLRSVREERPMQIGDRVGVIGAGDTAMDCARSALRVGASDVSIIYRRTIDQMPADPEEIHACIEEGINVVELAKPSGLEVSDGRLTAMVATRTEYTGERDASGRKIPFDVPDSEFTIPLDTILLAISQHSILGFFGDVIPEVSDRGYIAVDPETFETSVAGVYAGGDVAAHGPSSIVRAASDGKAAAASIIAALATPEPVEVETPPEFELHELVVRRSRREYRIPIKHTPVDEREGMDETVIGYTEAEAMAEASRCIDCDVICSLCVGVCPNTALMTHEMDAVRFDVPVVQASGGGIDTTTKTPFVADQQFQIAVLTDFCNECGNCVTACPTSGVPYLDKPRLYLNRDEFLAEEDNAFMMFEDGSIEGRFAGDTHRLSVNGVIDYTGPAVAATLDPETFAVDELGSLDGTSVSLEPAAVMYTVLSGISGSMEHLPKVPVGGTAGTLVADPQV